MFNKEYKTTVEIQMHIFYGLIGNTLFVQLADEENNIAYSEETVLEEITPKA